MNEPLRIYADTSVFGGPFDPEFAQASSVFFDQVRLGRFKMVTSAIVQAEVEPSPPVVRQLFEEMSGLAEIVEPTPEASTFATPIYKPASSVSDPRTMRFTWLWHPLTMRHHCKLEFSTYRSLPQDSAV